MRPEEIEQVFNGDPEYVFSYTKDGEERYRAFRVTARGRYPAVGYVERNELIRAITAWDMTRRERKIYDAKKIDQQK